MAVTITLTDAEAAAIPELIDLAQRGREDFQHQAAHGDYTTEDLAHAETRHKAAQAAADALTAQCAPTDQAVTGHPVIQAVEKWLPIADGMDTENIWDHFTCIEAEAVAAIARAANAPGIANLILSLHSDGDEEGDDHYTPPKED